MADPDGSLGIYGWLVEYHRLVPAIRSECFAPISHTTDPPVQSVRMRREWKAEQIRWVELARREGLEPPTPRFEVSIDRTSWDFQ